jgi:hypothetical protein
MGWKWIPCLFVIFFASSIHADGYTYLDYEKMRDKFLSLEKTYPTLVLVETAQEKYDLPALDCGEIEYKPILVLI